MAVNPTGWAIQGARHSAAVARGVLYDSTGGNAGISSPTSLRVRQTGTPSNQVQVAPGRASILNSYTGGDGQMYAFDNMSTTLVDIPASDSTGSKSWYVCATVHDPNYSGGGQWPADPKTGPYMFLEVFSVSETIPYAHIKVAQVDVPASTSTITNSMIKDLREISNPKVLVVPRFKAMVQGEEEILVSDDVEKGEYFPNNGGPQSIEIPDWAVRALIEVEWISTRFEAGNAWGQVWVEYGPYAGPSLRERTTQRMQWDTGSETSTHRGLLKVVDDVYIPASYRGTTQLFVPKATRVGGVNNSVSMDAMSAMAMKVWFQMVADSSTT